jgi:hypothetical protein
MSIKYSVWMEFASPTKNEKKKIEGGVKSFSNIYIPHAMRHGTLPIDRRLYIYSYLFWTLLGTMYYFFNFGKKGG